MRLNNHENFPFRNKQTFGYNIYYRRTGPNWTWLQKFVHQKLLYKTNNGTQLSHFYITGGWQTILFSHHWIAESRGFKLWSFLEQQENFFRFVMQYFHTKYQFLACVHAQTFTKFQWFLKISFFLEIYQFCGLYHSYSKLLLGTFLRIFWTRHLGFTY